MNGQILEKKNQRRHILKYGGSTCIDIYMKRISLCLYAARLAWSTVMCMHACLLLEEN